MASETPKQRLTRIKALINKCADEIEEISSTYDEFGYDYQGDPIGEKIDDARDELFDFADNLRNEVDLIQPYMNREFNENTFFALNTTKGK